MSCYVCAESCYMNDYMIDEWGHQFCHAKWGQKEELNVSNREPSQHQGGALTMSIFLQLSLGLSRRAPLRGLGLQLLQLADQQGQVLQQVPVLQQQLVDAGLSLHAGRTLRRHLILQQLHLKPWQQEGFEPHWRLSCTNQLLITSHCYWLQKMMQVIPLTTLMKHPWRQIYSLCLYISAADFSFFTALLLPSRGKSRSRT